MYKLFTGMMLVLTLALGACSDNSYQENRPSVSRKNLTPEKYAQLLALHIKADQAFALMKVKQQNLENFDKAHLDSNGIQLAPVEMSPEDRKKRDVLVQAMRYFAKRFNDATIDFNLSYDWAGYPFSTESELPKGATVTFSILYPSSLADYKD